MCIRDRQEQELLAPFVARAEAGGMLTVAEIQQAYRERTGKVVARSTVYRLLDRHGWRKIVPRPRHPKADVAAQAAFKKTPPHGTPRGLAPGVARPPRAPDVPGRRPLRAAGPAPAHIGAQGHAPGGRRAGCAPAGWAPLPGRLRRAAPRHRFFATVADPRTEPSFNPAMTNVELLTPEPVGLGTRFRARMGKDLDMEVRLTGFDRPTRMESVTTSPIMETSGALTLSLIHI